MNKILYKEEVYAIQGAVREPVEVRVLPDSLTISSFPGPDRSISDQDLQKFRFLSRRYRNRRVGEFLKELEMTEGRESGIPKILREIKKTDHQNRYFTQMTIGLFSWLNFLFIRFLPKP